jgi:hypothetical protein
MTNKIEVIRLHQAYPHWTAKKLAAVLNCTPAYIHACKNRYGLNIPRAINRRNTAFELGCAAMAAGLTVGDIEALER